MGGKTYHVLPVYPDKKEKNFASWSLYISDIWTVWLRYLKKKKKQDTHHPHLESEKLQPGSRII